jgi:hypothetical protein
MQPLPARRVTRWMYCGVIVDVLVIDSVEQPTPD